MTVWPVLSDLSVDTVVDRLVPDFARTVLVGLALAAGPARITKRIVRARVVIAIPCGC